MGHTMFSFLKYSFSKDGEFNKIALTLIKERFSHFFQYSSHEEAQVRADSTHSLCLFLKENDLHGLISEAYTKRALEAFRDLLHDEDPLVVKDTILSLKKLGVSFFLNLKGSWIPLLDLLKILKAYLHHSDHEIREQSLSFFTSLYRSFDFCETLRGISLSFGHDLDVLEDNYHKDFADVLLGPLLAKTACLNAIFSVFKEIQEHPDTWSSQSRSNSLTLWKVIEDEQRKISFRNFKAQILGTCHVEADLVREAHRRSKTVHKAFLSASEHL